MPSSQNTGASAATVTDVATGPSDRLCAVAPIPDDASLVYLRAYEAETDRWSAAQCDALASDGRPALCDDPAVPKKVRQRAWSSPVWL